MGFSFRWHELAPEARRELPAEAELFVVDVVSRIPKKRRQRQERPRIRKSVSRICTKRSFGENLFGKRIRLAEFVQKEVSGRICTKTAGKATLPEIGEH